MPTFQVILIDVDERAVSSTSSGAWLGADKEKTTRKYHAFLFGTRRRSSLIPVLSSSPANSLSPLRTIRLCPQIKLEPITSNVMGKRLNTPTQGQIRNVTKNEGGSMLACVAGGRIRCSSTVCSRAPFCVGGRWETGGYGAPQHYSTASNETVRCSKLAVRHKQSNFLPASSYVNTVWW